jgi:hypothetical protein
MPTKKNTPKKSKPKARNTPRKPLVEKPSSNRVSELTEPHKNAASDAYGGGAQFIENEWQQPIHTANIYTGLDISDENHFWHGFFVASSAWIGTLLVTLWFIQH